MHTRRAHKLVSVSELTSFFKFLHVSRADTARFQLPYHLVTHVILLFHHILKTNTGVYHELWLNGRRNVKKRHSSARINLSRPSKKRPIRFCMDTLWKRNSTGLSWGTTREHKSRCQGSVQKRNKIWPQKPSTSLCTTGGWHISRGGACSVAVGMSLGVGVILTLVDAAEVAAGICGAVWGKGRLTEACKPWSAPILHSRLFFRQRSIQI